MDIKDQLRVEFERSFRNLKEYDFLEKEISKAGNKKTKKSDKETSSKFKSIGFRTIKYNVFT